MFLLQGHTAKIADNTLVFSPDGRWLASGAFDNTAKVWNLTTRTERYTLAGHGDAVTGVGFLNGGAQLVTGSWDESMRIWDLEHGRRKKTIRPRETICYVTVSPDGGRIAAAGGEWWGGNQVWLWQASNLHALPKVGTHREQIGALAFSPNGRFLATGSADLTACVWNLRTKEREGQLRHTGWIQGLDFSPNSRLLAVAAGQRITLWSIDPEGGLPANHTILKGFRKTVLSVRFTPDGRQVIAGSKDGSVRVWDLTLERWTQVYRWKVGAIHAVAVAPDGLTAACGSDRGTIVVWDLE